MSGEGSVTARRNPIQSALLGCFWVTAGGWDDPARRGAICLSLQKYIASSSQASRLKMLAPLSHLSQGLVQTKSEEFISR
jgi:hypothetical protein